MNLLDDCGCCAGLNAETPAAIDNRPGLPAIAYRAGSYWSFRESLLARLSSADFPALARLTSRDDDDFTIALCAALATLLDVLTFYQERIANENYLRTATERVSAWELARLIGYRPAPGVAAATYLAFTLQEAPGAPEQAAAPSEIPVGVRVQSVPGPGEQPQTFETVAAIQARPGWNAIPAQTSAAWLPRRGDTDLYLAGVNVQLQPGDAILIVGGERAAEPGSERWDVRLVQAVEPDLEHDRTRVVWKEGVGHAVPLIDPAANNVRVYVFRQRAALFGHNAPDPRLMANTKDTALGALVEGAGITLNWKNYAMAGTDIDLDTTYPRIVPGSWFALVSNEHSVANAALPGYVELYRARTVSQVSRRDFGLSAKITRLEPDTTENLDRYRNRIRETLVLAQSELLQTTERPLPYPMYGDTLALATRVEGLTPGLALAVSGRRQRLRIAPGVKGLSLSLDDGASIPLREGDSLTLLAAPEQVLGGGTLQGLAPPQFGAALATRPAPALRLRLEDRDERRGTLVANADQIVQEPARKDDAVVAQIAFIAGRSDAVTQSRDRTTLALAASLHYCYDRATVRVNANVAPATHGETVNEILGGGDAGLSDQSFVLRQVPLTYVSAATPSGRASTLEVRVNELLWQEVPTLYGRGPGERVYTTSLDDAGRTTVRYGDGGEGARLPSGQDNVRARYRKSSGAAGNLAANKLSTLLSRPLGVVGAVNPVAAGGGVDPETLEDTRVNAPLTVLTLDRAVSVRDYEDYARSFAGIAKAHALWISSGPARGIFITVAGVDGAAVDASSATYRNLVSSLRQYGDPLAPLRVESYRPARFRLRAMVKVAADALTATVLAEVETALRERFGCAARTFGQPVSVDEVAAAIHAVASVEAVQITQLYRPGPGAVAQVEPRLFAELPLAMPQTVPLPAELLLLEEGPLVLEELP